MTKTKLPRGRPKLALEDNEACERILNTAQQLFAEKGFSKVSLRELTAAAQTHLAAVNYYFGSKDKLLEALIQRSAKAIYKERMALLEAANRAETTPDRKARQIIHALIAPVITPTAGTDNYLLGTLMARTLSDAPRELTDLVERQTSHLTPFAEAIKAVLPALSMAAIHWRLHFILNIEHSVLTENKRLIHLSGGLCDASDRAALLENILDFVMPGLVATEGSGD